MIGPCVVMESTLPTHVSSQRSSISSLFLLCCPSEGKCVYVRECVYVIENMQHHTGEVKVPARVQDYWILSSKHRQLKEKPSPSPHSFNITLLSLFFPPPVFLMPLPLSLSLSLLLLLPFSVSSCRVECCRHTTTAGECWEMGQRSHL